MTGARRRATAIAVSAVVLLMAAGWWFLDRDRAASRNPVRAGDSRPTLLLLTSLPIVFGERFSVEQTGSPVLAALERDYRVVPISVASAQELAKGRLLLMAQPSAQAPGNLVALDQWVSGGGRVMLLADPLLEWPSELALGDSLRPPHMFNDTGLLGHWGLRLDSPDEPGPQRRRLGGYDVATFSPGSLFGTCDIGSDRLVARCRIDEGRAVVVADADLLNVAQSEEGLAHNLRALVSELEQLRR